MGITRIDFGSVELKEGGRKALKDGSKVRALPKSFKFDHSTQKGTPYIGVTYEVDDPDAEDYEGGKDYGKVFQEIYITDKAVKMAKLHLKGLGVDVDNLIVEDEEDLRDLVEDLRATAVDVPVLLVTENEESFKDPEVPRTRVKFINRVDS